MRSLGLFLKERTRSNCFLMREPTGEITLFPPAKRQIFDPTNKTHGVHTSMVCTVCTVHTGFMYILYIQP